MHIIKGLPAPKSTKHRGATKVFNDPADRMEIGDCVVCADRAEATRLWGRLRWRGMGAVTRKVLCANGTSRYAVWRTADDLTRRTRKVKKMAEYHRRCLAPLVWSVRVNKIKGAGSYGLGPLY
jgi:hypothetical protein